MVMTRREFVELSSSAVLGASAAASGRTAGAKFRACVIGDSRQGGYGHNMHLVWALREDVQVVGLADPDETGRAKHAREADAQRTYADYREMLDKEKPDLLAIGPRWSVHHPEYLEAAAVYGAHGLMEKPIAVDLAAADAMVQTIEARNLKWAIGFNFRANALIQHVKRTVFEQDLIGDILELRGRGKEDRRAGGEDLIVLGTHIFDMMRFFLGDPKWCIADITVDGRPATRSDIREATEPVGPVLGDRIHAVYGFRDGIVGHFASTSNRDGNGGRWGLDIFGSKGIVTIRLDRRFDICLLRDPAWAPGGKDLRWQPLPDAPAVEIRRPELENYLPIVDDLIAAIGEDRRPKTSLQDGRDSLEMIQAVHEAYLNGGRAVMPLKQRDHPLYR